MLYRALALSIGLLVCGHSAVLSAIRTGMGAIDARRLEALAAPAGDWLGYGGSYSETRFSPLDQINEKTVPRLNGLAGTLRDQEARAGKNSA
jgi:glucose dehydrogenase